MLNWSGERDEEADFELNIRAVSGGAGLIVGADGVSQEPAVVNLTPAASNNRNQLKIRGIPAWDAIEAYLQNGIRAPISPLRGSTDPDIAAGRELFTQAGCQNCHGTALWTTSRVRFTPPPDASLVSAGQILPELRNVGTFNAQVANEVRQNAAAPLGADGFVPPSLLSIFAFPQTFFHGGLANSLEEAMQNVRHRSLGTGTDTLQDAAKRAQLIKFLLSIDAATPPIAPPAPTKLTITSSAWNIGAKLAPDSLASAYGEKLSTDVASPTSATLPLTLAGTTVAVQDKAGQVRLGQMFYAGPGQVNFIVPGSSATGTADITVTSNSGATATGGVEVADVAPAVFVMPGGTTAAAVAVRGNAAGVLTPLEVFQCTAAPVCTPVPIDLGAAGDVTVVTFFGTGIRKNAGLESVKATVGGVDAPVLFAAAQGQFAGLDQVNVQIPVSLRGRGQVDVRFTVSGQTTNNTVINIR
jgi:uncharacterized protein (TIGR03437 family)